jgi:hypothetical protein
VRPSASHDVSINAPLIERRQARSMLLGTVMRDDAKKERPPKRPLTFVWGGVRDQSATSATGAFSPWGIIAVMTRFPRD